MTAEEWRPVVGCPDYFVSSHGRVKSMKVWRYQQGRILSGHTARFGYPCVHLFGTGRGGKRNRSARSIHSLVLEAFVGSRPEGLEIRHLDGDPTNCRLENLAYGTHAENEQDKLRHGTQYNAAKTECIYGHPYSPENTRTYLIERASGGDGYVHRYCIECDRRRSREYRARKMLRAAGITASAAA